MNDDKTREDLIRRRQMGRAKVMALLLGVRWTLARQGMGGQNRARRDIGFTVVGTLSLDGRNRLVVIRRGEAELVLAIGPQGISRLDFPRSLEGPACE